MDLCVYALLGALVCGTYLYLVTWQRVRAREKAEWYAEDDA